MKKLVILLLGVFLSISLTSCGDDETIIDPLNPDTETPDAPDNDQDDDAPDVNARKILIVYFSRIGYNYPNQWLNIGHTARIAGYIAELTGGDRFEIVPVVPYPDNYQETVSIARKEYDSNARPAITGRVENIDEYDTVFIAGRVVSVGKDVTKFKVGDLAGVGCMIGSCRECDACKHDLEQYCEEGAIMTYHGIDRFNGDEHTQGGYSNTYVVAEDFAIKVPADADITKVAPLLCAGITSHPFNHSGKIRAGDVYENAQA